jgi:Cysteine-rich secretory protein family
MWSLTSFCYIFSVKKTFKKYFIPHAGNDYHPHILHAKRAWFYGTLGVFIKCIVVFAVVLLPAEAYVMPDIVAVEESKAIMLTNNLRASAGVPKLKENAKLSASAVFKAEDMADKNYFAHESPEGNRLAYFLTKAGYKYRSAGENLAIGYFDATEVVAAWKASPTHKANMLDKDFTEIGIGSKGGVYDGAATLYIAEHFGSPDSSGDAIVSVALTGDNTPAVVTDKNVLAEKTSTQSDRVSWLYKYKTADNILSDTMPFFGYSKMIYLCLILFFAVVLVINVLVEMKIRHKHVIVRTLGLLGVLVGLWLI